MLATTDKITPTREVSKKKSCSQDTKPKYAMKSSAKWRPSRVRGWMKLVHATSLGLLRIELWRIMSEHAVPGTLSRTIWSTTRFVSSPAKMLA